VPLYAGVQLAPPEAIIAPRGPDMYVPTWHGPDGSVLALNPGKGWFRTMPAVAGIGAVPVEIVSTPDPDGGVVVEYVRAKERTIIWPLFMRGNSHTEFLELWRSVVEAFTITRRLGPGRLRITRPDGTAREIPARYQSGFELEASGSDGAWTYATAPLSLLCPSPWWQDVDPTVIAGEESAGASFLGSYPTVSSGEVLGDTTALVQGDEPVWPTWTIRGPMTQLVATNNTRGESFTLTHTLAANSTITISARPIRVVDESGVSLIDKLNLPTGKPWRLDPGTSSITFSVTGAAPASGPDAATRIELSFKQLRETC